MSDEMRMFISKDSLWFGYRITRLSQIVSGLFDCIVTNMTPQQTTPFNWIALANATKIFLLTLSLSISLQCLFTGILGGIVKKVSFDCVNRML